MNRDDAQITLEWIGRNVKGTYSRPIPKLPEKYDGPGRLQDSDDKSPLWALFWLLSRLSP